MVTFPHPDAGYGATRVAAPPGRRRRWPGRLLVALVVLVLLALAADRGGDYIAEQVAASSIQDSQDLASEPDVDIGGFPFLTQFATGHYDEVTITAHDVDVGPLTLSQIRVVLDELTVSRGFDRFHADGAHAVATVGYDRLSDAFGIRLSYAGDGRVRLSKQFTILGQTFRPSVTVAPVVTNGVLKFGKAQINGANGLAGEVADALSDFLGTEVPLDGIPFEVDVQKVAMTADGLRIDLVGSDLTYTK